jgi:steroid 5-alpha reductase family enzyme
LFFMMFYYFGISAGSHPESIGIIDIFGISIFLFGSCINTLADCQRFRWKKIQKTRGGYTPQDSLNTLCILTTLEMLLPILGWR